MSGSEELVFFYKRYPRQQILLEDLKRCARSRINVLRQLEEINDLDLSKFNEICQSNGLYHPMIKNSGSKEDDILGHFMLQAAFSRASKDMRSWFKGREQELMRYRIKCIGKAFGPAEMGEVFLKLISSEYSVEKLTPEEMQHYEEDLMSVAKPSERLGAFFKIPFYEIANLVRKREVLIVRGVGFVSANQIDDIALSLHQKYLERGLDYAGRYQLVIRDERVRQFLEELPSVSFVRELGNFDVPVGKLCESNIDSYSARSFPPCMQRIHQFLRANHHLKHFARLQYTLFLKGAGMSNEECLQMLRREFTPPKGRVPLDKFDKEYSYYINHVYGVTGSKTNYTPYSCAYIITKNKPSGPQDSHGCVFAHSSNDELDRFLMTRGISTDSQEWKSIRDNKRSLRYTAGCREFFATQHEKANEMTIDKIGRHPNVYFYCSLRHYEDVVEIEDPKSHGSVEGPE